MRAEVTAPRPIPSDIYRGPRSPAVAVAVSAGSYEGPQIKGVAYPGRGVVCAYPGSKNPDHEGSGRSIANCGDHT